MKDRKAALLLAKHCELGMKRVELRALQKKARGLRSLWYDLEAQGKALWVKQNDISRTLYKAGIDTDDPNEDLQAVASAWADEIWDKWRKKDPRSAPRPMAEVLSPREDRLWTLLWRWVYYERQQARYDEYMRAQGYGSTMPEN